MNFDADFGRAMKSVKLLCSSPLVRQKMATSQHVLYTIGSLAKVVQLAVQDLQAEGPSYEERLVVTSKDLETLCCMSLIAWKQVRDKLEVHIGNLRKVGKMPIVDIADIDAIVDTTIADLEKREAIADDATISATNDQTT